VRVIASGGVTYVLSIVYEDSLAQSVGGRACTVLQFGSIFLRHQKRQDGGDQGDMEFLRTRYSSALRRRSELVITDTELKLMAAAARIGLSNQPKNG
jgi:hypothetical protein